MFTDDEHDCVWGFPHRLFCDDEPPASKAAPLSDGVEYVVADVGLGGDNLVVGVGEVDVCVIETRGEVPGVRDVWDFEGFRPCTTNS